MKKLSPADVLERAWMWAQAGHAFGLPAVRTSADLGRFFEEFASMVAEDDRLARKLLAMGRARSGDKVIGLLDMLDSADRAERAQACDLVMASDSKEIWTALMLDAECVPVDDQAVPALALRKGVTTVVWRHREFVDSRELRCAMLQSPFHDYRGVTSLLVRAPVHNEAGSEWETLEALSRHEDLEEVILDLRRQDGYHPPPRISLRGLDALPRVTRLTLILDRGLSREGDVPSPHWPITERGWSFTDEWTRHLGHIEELRVVADQPRHPIPRGRQATSPGCQHLFPYALTAHMPALQAVYLHAPVTYAHVDSTWSVPTLLVHTGDMSELLPEAAEGRERLRVGELVLLQDVMRHRREPHEFRLRTGFDHSADTPRGPCKIDLRQFPGVSADRIAFEPDAAPGRQHDVEYASQPSHGFTHGSTTASTVEFDEPGDAEHASPSPSPLTLTHVDVLAALDPTPALTAGRHVAADSKHVTRDILFTGKPLDVPALRRALQRDVEFERKLSAIQVFTGEAGAVHVARHHGVTMEEVLRWCARVHEDHGEGWRGGHGVRLEAPAVSTLDLYSDDLSLDAKEHTATRVHLRVRSQRETPKLSWLPRTTKALVIEGFPRGCFYSAPGFPPSLKFEALAKLPALEELTLVRVYHLKPSIFSAFKRLKRLTLLGCSATGPNTADIIRIPSSALGELKHLDIHQDPRAQSLPTMIDASQVARATQRYRRAFLKNILQGAGLGLGARLRTLKRLEVSPQTYQGPTIPSDTVWQVVEVDSDAVVFPHAGLLGDTDPRLVGAVKVRQELSSTPGDETVLPLPLRDSVVWGEPNEDFEVITRADAGISDEEAWVAGEPHVDRVLKSSTDMATLAFRVRCLG